MTNIRRSVTTGTYTLIHHININRSLAVANNNSHSPNIISTMSGRLNVPIEITLRPRTINTLKTTLVTCSGVGGWIGKRGGVVDRRGAMSVRDVDSGRTLNCFLPGISRSTHGTGGRNHLIY